MADNYLQFSFAIQLNSEDEREWVETILTTDFTAEELGLDEISKKRREEFLSVFKDWGDWECLGFDWEIDGEGELWIYAEDGMGNPSMAADFIQAYLMKFDPKAHVSFEFAETCSKPRLDEFGGGAVIITADTQLWMSTSKWIEEKLEELRKMGQL